MEKKLIIELIKSIKESNERLEAMEDLIASLASTSRSRHGAEIDVAVPITEEVYKKICKELGAESLFFMAIA